MRKRLWAMVLVVAMTVGLLAGCGGSIGTDDKGEEASGSGETAELDTSEKVELTMYVIGDRPAGQDVVDDAFNELISDKLNCTLKINWLPWASYQNQYPLLFTSGEVFDMAYSGFWLNFAAMARKGAFMNLDDLWETYAPKNFALQTDAAKEQAMVDGHYYCIPSSYGQYNTYGAIYREDLVEGSGWDGVMKDFTDMEEYLDIIKETHPEMEPLDIYSMGSELDDTYFYSVGYRPTNATNDFLRYDPTEEKPELKTFYELEETKDFLEIMNRWNEKGFFSKTALADADSTKMQNGKAAMRVHNIGTYNDLACLHPEWNIKYANMVQHMAHSPYNRDVLVISNTSENPERALALWDLITTDQEVFDTFYYGVLGTTYELDDEGNYAITDPDLYAVSNMWAARTSELNRNPSGTPKEYIEQLDTFEKMIEEDGSSERFSAFVLDTSSIETEYAACQSVHQQYWWPLELGYTDPETGLAEYEEKMKAAGIETVKAELQKQLDAFAESHP